MDPNTILVAATYAPPRPTHCQCNLPNYQVFVDSLLPVEQPISEKCSICWLPFFQVDDDVSFGINRDNLQNLWQMPLVAARTTTVPDNRPVQVNCQGKHQFGLSCLLTALESGGGSNRCPICRQELFVRPPRHSRSQAWIEFQDSEHKYLQDEKSNELPIRDIIIQKWPAGTTFEIIAGEAIIDLGRDTDQILKRFTKFRDANPHPTMKPRVHARKVFQGAHRHLIPTEFARSEDMRAVAEVLRSALLKLHEQILTPEAVEILLSNAVGAQLPAAGRGKLKQGKWKTFLEVLIRFVVNKAVWCSRLRSWEMRMYRHELAGYRGWLCDEEPSRALLPPAAHIDAWWCSGRSLPAVSISFQHYYTREVLVKHTGRCTGPFRLADPYEAWVDQGIGYCHLNEFPGGKSVWLGEGQEDEAGVVVDYPDTDISDDDFSDSSDSNFDEAETTSKALPILRAPIYLHRDFDISDAFRETSYVEGRCVEEFQYVPGSGYWFMRDEVPDPTSCQREGNIYSHHDAEIQ
ncbi:hypothetical protein K490DRAFT_62691 [Saccharata proteae CBS 121410]|uniref:Uncharacterized protein n=1 Tax=Saccharata proteae CBS 121410 TaxID=1314787 RepID=A0A9P4LYE6_9PEZI|nr:hypothetical protein K490DRAFT_62691 [Saccharata proteae CBS 121410]